MPASFDRRFMLLLAVPTLFALMLLSAACSMRDENGSGSLSAPTREDDQHASVERDDDDKDGVTNEEDQCPNTEETGNWGNMDGCPDTIDDLVALAAHELDGFWKRTFDGAGERYDTPFTVAGYVGGEETGCGETVPANAFYCPVDRGIYYDQALFDVSLNDIGDFAPVFILAHEWGHYIQDQLGLLSERGRAGIQNELQADCFAGLFSADAEERGLLEPGDTEEALQIAFEAGDPSGARQSPESHGTSKQRQQAFALGYEGDIQECLDI